MKLGVVYPQTELAGDPRALHEIGVAVDMLGYDSLLFYDHVVGAEHADREPPLWGPYTEHDPFHDPLVAFGYLAGVTHSIELATGVLILPQRQTALVAQQSADADLLSGGRVRLGVGVGWNWVEYVALGQDFATRGERLDEQIGLLRALWSEPLVSFEGRFDRIERGCINPRPARTIPIWIGGFGERAFRRGGQLGDGFTFAGSLDDATEGLTRVRHHLAEAGRSSVPFGAELITSRAQDIADVVATAERWKEVGGTHLSVLTTRFGFHSITEHVDFVAAAKAALDARLGQSSASA
jgi:probable F420-dependent oxidoreductase